VAGLLAGKGLDELTAASRAGRAEVERLLRESLGEEAPRRGRQRPAAAAVPSSVVPQVIAYSDGASRGNPGPSAIGFRVLAPDGAELLAEGRRIGIATNNVAEYRGVIAVLERIRDLGIREVELRLDSELIVEQLNGRYRVRQPKLAALKKEVDRLGREFRELRVVHVSRELNREADKLANEALDGK
jgi:ribonuclease HI/probable phosphoglycerate mutase